MRNKQFWFRSALLLIFAGALAISLGVSGAAAESTDQSDVVAGTYRGVSPIVRFDVSPPMTEIAASNPEPGTFYDVRERDSDLAGELGPQDLDQVVQDSVGPGSIPGPIISFDGMGNISGVSPPDPVGDVGPNHYVAMSNLSWAVYDKPDGAVLLGPLPNNSIWAGFGGDCQTDNSGDPIVLYDQFADRWILSQFTASGPTYFNCIAISTTPDPTSTYYRYAVGTGTNFPDYPKYGVWEDAYYISTREFAGASFAGVGAYAVDRAAMIAGNPAPTVISFLAAPGATPYNLGDGLLPSDVDGNTWAPAGSPNYYVGSMDDGGQYGAPQDALTIWEFDADFVTPANSTFTLENTVPVAAFDSQFPCSPTSRHCIPQPDTSNKVDILSYRQRPMWRLAYRNFGSHEALVTNQSVEAATNMAGIRWYELRDPGGTPTVYQQGTYAPGVADGIHRWMGSIAQDKDGNMALGYSASAATVTYPSVWYTGRLAGDPLGTMPQGEGSIINGTGSQTGSQRWGDYTSMNVDPVDDCTFWYVNEYVPTTSSVGWRLRIGSFKFDECVAGGGDEPNIFVDPLSMSSTQNTNTVVMQTLTISNTGTADLDWTIAEDNASPLGGPWSDDFDSYATGQDLHGVNGWKGWNNDPTFTAFTSDVQAHSAPNSVDIAGNSDLVHEYSVSSGQWIYTAWQYIPSAFAGDSFFIMLNQYDDAQITDNWSVQVHFDSVSNQVISDNEGSTLPLITGQWVEIRLEIDLDADTQTFYYDNTELYTKSWSEGVSGGGITSIAAVDLFANAASSVYYDDMSLVEVGGGGPCDAPDDIPWLTVSPTAGTNAGGTATDVGLTYDSTGLAAGTYNGDLCIGSNDPDPGPGNETDLVIVPVELIVEQPTDVGLSGIGGDATASASAMTMVLALALVGVIGFGLVRRRRPNAG